MSQKELGKSGASWADNDKTIQRTMVTHLHFCQPHKTKLKMQKSYQANAPQTDEKKKNEA
ncbi:hypothetical protein MASR2M12_26870 [Bacteroidales bacterium]